MIRTIAVPRPLRVGAVAASVAGIALLAGCAAPVDEADPAETADDTGAGSSETAETPATGGSESAGGGVYADGTYTAEGSYQTPESVETITVTVTLEDDIVTSVEVVGEPTRRESEQYQGQFIGGIADVVEGVALDEIDVDRVAGSSLTSGGFNAALEEIRTDAAA